MIEVSVRCQHGNRHNAACLTVVYELLRVAARIYDDSGAVCVNEETVTLQFSEREFLNSDGSAPASGSMAMPWWSIKACNRGAPVWLP